MPDPESNDPLDDVSTDPVDDGGEQGEQPGADGEKDWQEEYEKTRRLNRDLERRSKRNLKRVQDLEAEIANIRNGDGEDGKPANLEEIRKKAQAEARAETLRERVLDRIEAKAARLFADPEDAVALLGRRIDDFVDDGKVDTAEITEALEALLKKKPHLAAAPAKRFQGGADGGARKGSQVAQITEQELKRMTPQQIVDAQAAGRLDDLLGVTT